MRKSTSPTERVADKLTAITTAVEALFKHTNKAISLRDKVNRTTVLGSGTGPDALPAKGEVLALVQKMPGTADEDYDNADDAKEVRGKIAKSVSGFVKTAVKKSRCAARFYIRTARDTPRQQTQEHRTYQERAYSATSRYQRDGRRHDGRYA